MQAQLTEEQLQKQIETIVSHKNFSDAYDSMTQVQHQRFLEAYFLNETLDYDAEIKTRTEEGNELIKLALEKEKGQVIFSQDLLDGIILISKMAVMDTLIKKVHTVYENLRTKLKDNTINDLKTTMVFQMCMGSLAMEYNQLLTQEIVKNCSERKIDIEEFMQHAFPQLTGDFSIFFEIDNYNGLKIFQTLKDIKITQPQAEDYISRTTGYSKMVIEGNMNPQTTIVFPNLINHFLFNETQLENVQVLNFVMNKVKEGINGANLEFFKLLFEEIYYIEKGRGVIYNIFQMQMQFMDQMMQSNVSGDSELGQPAWGIGSNNNSLPNGMDFNPAMMNQGFNNANSNPIPHDLTFNPMMMNSGLDNMNPNQIPNGMAFDPMMMNSTFESMNSNAMPSMEEMLKAMEGLDFSKLAEMFPNMENMMKDFTQNMGGNIGNHNEKPNK